VPTTPREPAFMPLGIGSQAWPLAPDIPFDPICALGRMNALDPICAFGRINEFDPICALGRRSPLDPICAAGRAIDCIPENGLAVRAGPA
jgi:hypothetical protein